MSNQKYQLGLIGLGVMGRNLLFNMADSGYAVAGYDKDTEKVDALNADTEGFDILGTPTVEGFLDALEKPRRVLLLVPAGKIVDYVIEDLLPHLDEGDIIIDGGNSHFPDTNRRQEYLTPKNIHFISMGVSGGAAGARLGPSMMPSGNKEAYGHVKELLESVAAKVNGEPCITYLGQSSAGHYVKMVHNGIEYGLMQLITEIYDLMKRGRNFDNEKIGNIFSEWNEAELESFLVDITAKIFQKKEPNGEQYTVDIILDKSKSKGTGKWTSQDAMNLGAPVPVIDMAVIARMLSSYKAERKLAADKLQHSSTAINHTDEVAFVKLLRDALYFAFVVSYAQGMEQLKQASEEYDYKLVLKDVTRIWRGGCIIRADMLNKFYDAYVQNPDLSNLMMDDVLSKELLERQDAIRAVINMAVNAAIPVPCLMAALTYFDSYRSERLPANLIQAQRDFFGSHTYERIDKPGIFHTEWE